MSPCRQQLLLLPWKKMKTSSSDQMPNVNELQCGLQIAKFVFMALLAVMKVSLYLE
jgi:hypothetical protein